ncbi:fasciclin domain-containing protein [Sphaerisporangium corydalis]|uniref:Fasciclin domain-containing protein n=1 Tax=Sphaerisporangium corydalis TaxID=1441875 RepID=A0ABV9E8G9_9ACTN|nr:fasciclin domain-containing protein [Sphaerisporangium corydalis]
MNTRLLAFPVVAAMSLAAAYGTAAGALTSGTGAMTPETARTSDPSTSASPTSSPIGKGCSALPQSGPGSPGEIANEPVATAASHIPDLSTLVDAAKKAGLVDTLNSAKDITIFAPSNAAFDKIPKDQLDKLLANKGELTKILTYHVVQGRKTPADLEKGDVATVEGAKVATKRDGDTVKIGGAEVLCGDLQTQNATVYVIDSVLKPGA